MGFAHVRCELDRGFEMAPRLVIIGRAEQRPAQIEMGRRRVGLQFHRTAVMLDGAGQIAEVIEGKAEIGVRCGMAGLGLDRGTVAGDGIFQPVPGVIGAAEGALNIGRARPHVARPLKAFDRLVMAFQLAQELPHARQALGGGGVDLGCAAESLKGLFVIVKRHIGAPEIAVIGGIGGIAGDGALDQFDRFAGLIACQPNEAGEMQGIGKIGFDFEQQAVESIRLVQAPGLMVLHGHIENFAAVLRRGFRLLRRAVIPRIFLLYVNHFMRLTGWYLKND